MDENFSMEDFEKYLDQSFRKVYNGDIVTGRIMAKDDQALVVDVGADMDGIVPVEELLYDGESLDQYQVGDNITCTVKFVNSREGQIMLSKKQADAMTIWTRLQQIKDEGGTVDVKVKRVVNGGLRIGWETIEGFMPASQISLEHVDDLNAYVGQTLTAMIMDVKEDKKDLVVSRKLLERREADEARKSVYGELKRGQTITGKVVRIANFGAFVEVAPHVDGLVHVSDMSWSRVKNPADVVSVGDIVTVTVMDIDSERQRISLSLRDVDADPWQNLRIRADQVVEGTVTRVIPSGAFVEVAPGVEGYVHVSRISEKRIGNAMEALQPGQTVTAKVLTVDPAEKRISLSIRDAATDAAAAEDRAIYQQHRADNQEISTSLGDLLRPFHTQQ
ncbi:MAG: 30S ribosomal protein S1 [Firmicutes bacterium]|nr:30S ribosomal protein S1 [Bacillota bacterium]